MAATSPRPKASYTLMMVLMLASAPMLKPLPGDACLCQPGYVAARPAGSPRAMAAKILGPAGCSISPDSVAWRRGAAHQHRADVEVREAEKLPHDVDHALQPYLVHGADRPGADRVAVQGQDRRRFRGDTEWRRHVHHGLLHGGAADVRYPLTLFQCPVERGERVRMLRRPLLGDHVALDWEARGGTLVQVGERHAALA